MIISFRPTAEVGAHAFVVDHHVHAAIVAVADGRLALAVQYLVYKLSSISAQRWCKSNAESSLFAEMQPVFTTFHCKYSENSRIICKFAISFKCI